MTLTTGGIDIESLICQFISQLLLIDIKANPFAEVRVLPLIDRFRLHGDEELFDLLINLPTCHGGVVLLHARVRIPPLVF